MYHYRGEIQISVSVKHKDSDNMILHLIEILQEK